MFFGCLQYTETSVLFKADFISGNSQKSVEAKSGEQGGCSISVIDFFGPETT
jgi:hypothetical protein